MKSTSILLRFLFFAAFFIVMIKSTNAQANNSSPANPDLYKEISGMDSSLFTAFNTKDINRFKTFFTQDLEFYHDKGGLTNYEYTINYLKTMATDLRRELVNGSLEVYPIPGYGAMEIGAHTFCHLENGKQDCGTFKFVHIWLKKNGEWKISRVVSYGH